MNSRFPITTLGLLGRGFHVLRADFVTFATLAFLANLPAIGLGSFLLGESSDPDVIRIGSAISGLLTLVLSSVATGAIVYGVFKILRGERADLGGCLGLAAGRWLPLIGLALVSGLGVVAGTLLCVIPGIVIYCGWFVAVPALMVERTGVMDSLSRSWELTAENRGPIFGALVVLWLVGLAVATVISVLGGGSIGSIMEPQSPVQYFLTTAIDVVLGALGSVMAGVAYHDLRLAKDELAEDELVAVFA